MSSFGVKISPPLGDVVGELVPTAETALAASMLRASELLITFIDEEIDIWLSEPAADNVVRTGLLRGSFEALVTKTTAGAFSRVPYARIHNRGGVIRPTQASKLTIPLNREAALTPARFFDNLIPIRSKAGNLILAQVIGKKQLRPMFVLKDEVRIPARNYLDNAADRAATPISEEIADRVLVEAGEALDG